MGAKYDFSGWATKNDIKCSDGRTIRKNAFIDNDGKKVPLVWNHQHNDPSNVLGHAMLENRNDGVYAYCTLNDTEAGNTVRELLQHGDVTALSIYANGLRQRGGDVLHGAIKEVSVVLAGANPGAYIDSVIAHSDGAEEGIVCAFVGNNEIEYIQHSEDEEEDEMYEDYEDEYDDYEDDEDIQHSDEETIGDILDTLNEKQLDAVYALIGSMSGSGEMSHSDISDEDETIQDVFNTLSEKQKKVVYAMIGMALESKGGNEDMKHNVFDNEMGEANVLSHSEIEAIFTDAKRSGSGTLKDAVLAHADAYGIEHIDYLFPDAKAVSNTPDFIKRDTDWVSTVMNGVHKQPFSRIKSIHANITADEARAKGYIKGKRKLEEVFTLLKRSTDPQTIYKKQKLDRDDIIDITDFDVVAWLKQEMRIMLDEEIARAILIGDGRLSSSDDKIQETHIRPIWTDDDLYSVKVNVKVTGDKAKDTIKAAIKARKDYKGSGNPVFFTTEDMLTDMLLIEDGMGRPLYESEEKLRTTLRVSKIETVEVMEGAKRNADGTNMELLGIIVNLKDYNVGADKGGAINMFDDFDIDFNQQKYLMETRCSGALVKPFSALVLETEVTGE